MKNILKDRFSLMRLLAVLLTLSILIPLAVLPSFADSGESVASFSRDASGHVVGRFPAKNASDTATEKTYRPYDGVRPDRIFALPAKNGSGVQYTESLTIDGERYDLYSNKYGGDCLYLIGETSCTMLFSDEGIRMAENMLREQVFTDYVIAVPPKNGQYRFSRHRNSLDEEIASLPTRGGQTKTFDTAVLEYAPQYPLVRFSKDSTWVGVCNGILYKLGEDYYYLDFDSLPAGLLSSAGDLNYGLEAEVTLWLLPESAASEVSDAVYNAVDYSGYTREKYLSDETDPMISLTVAVIVCVLAALVPIIVGLVKYRRQHKRRWFLLVGMGLLWLLCGLLIVGLLIFI